MRNNTRLIIKYSERFFIYALLVMHNLLLMKLIYLISTSNFAAKILLFPINFCYKMQQNQLEISN